MKGIKFGELITLANAATRINGTLLLFLFSSCSKRAPIRLNKSIDDNMEECECAGVICILFVDSSLHSDPPTKCEITSSSIKFYTHDGEQWIENS